jgi:phosphomannomutase
MLERDILIGGEESGGIGVKRFLPERDGILVGLLLMEMRAAAGRGLGRSLESLEKEYGRYAYRRVDLPLPPGRARQAVARLLQSPPRRLAGVVVRGVDPLDGVKLLLGDEGWILFRGSGTEPLLRVYCEARTGALVERLIRAGTARARAAAG